MASNYVIISVYQQHPLYLNVFLKEVKFSLHALWLVEKMTFYFFNILIFKCINVFISLAVKSLQTNFFSQAFNCTSNNITRSFSITCKIKSVLPLSKNHSNDDKYSKKFNISSNVLCTQLKSNFMDG